MITYREALIIACEQIPVPESPPLTKAIKKPIDSSARNPLIYIELMGVPSGLRPSTGGEGRRENVQTESKICRLLAEIAHYEVRKNPRKHAVVGKKANPEGLVFPLLVESAGIEPASANPLQQVLHT